MCLSDGVSEVKRDEAEPQQTSGLIPRSLLTGSLTQWYDRAAVDLLKASVSDEPHSYTAELTGHEIRVDNQRNRRHRSRAIHTVSVRSVIATRSFRSLDLHGQNRSASEQARQQTVCFSMLMLAVWTMLVLYKHLLTLLVLGNAHVIAMDEERARECTS